MPKRAKGKYLNEQSGSLGQKDACKIVATALFGRLELVEMVKSM
jgi:hypothetical protein